MFGVIAALALLVWLERPVPLALTCALLGGLMLLGLVRWRAGPAQTAAAVVAVTVSAAGIGAEYLSRLWGPGTSLLHPDFDALYATLGEVRKLLVGWVLVLWIPWSGERSPSGIGPGPARWSIPVLLLLSLCLLVSVHRYLTPLGFAGFTDEILYIFQGSLFETGRVRAPLPDALAPSLATVKSVAGSGGLHSQYPPGWPAALSLFGHVGLDRWAPPILALAALSGAVLIAHRLGGTLAALLSGAALLLNVHFLRWSSGYLAHALTAAAMVWMAAALLLAESRGSGTRWRLALFAGCLGGIAMVTRPLTGLALSTAIWLVALLRNRRTPGFAWPVTAGLCLGGVVPVLGLLAYNQVTNGAPFALGYAAAHEGGHSLGFGIQRRTAYDATGTPYLTEFVSTPREAVRRLLMFVGIAARTVLPSGMVAAVFWLAWRNGFRFGARWTVFLLLPAAYFFWPTVTYRSMSEVFPFVAVAAGLALSHLWATSRRGAAGLLVLLIAAAAFGTPHDIRAMARGPRAWVPYFERARALSADGPVVIFVGRGIMPDDEALYERLWLFNARHWMGPTVVARDLGPGNAALLARLPTHRGYHISWQGRVPSAADVVVRPTCGGLPCAADGATPDPDAVP